jgi:hypothetical protein
MRRMQRYTGLGDGPGYFVLAFRRGVSSFFAIAGLVAVVFGLLYRFADHELPRLLQGHELAGPGLSSHAAAGLNASRATFLLAVGAAGLLVAWVIHPRARS